MSPTPVSPLPPQPAPTYLGDGVYASFDGYNVLLWISDGINNSPKIALEPAVIAALNAYVKRGYRP